MSIKLGFGNEQFYPINNTLQTEQIQQTGTVPKDKPLLQFSSTNNTQQIAKTNSDKNSEQYKSDAQQLTEDALYLKEIWDGLEQGEQWAIDIAKNLTVAQDPDKNDTSSNANLLRSNNELAAAIVAKANGIAY